ncbi:MAG: hypothetical protein HXX13_08425 [Bacteroidetes bacterium]|nr:hypothetical protein [Bacteroidota bacterium]
MTEDQLKEVMKFHLQNFNNEGVAINDQTIHNTVLSDSDGFGDSNSKSIYRAAIRWTIQKNGAEDKPWPADWFDNNVAYLASKLI